MSAISVQADAPEEITFVLEVSDKQEQLGLALASYPPDPVIVKRIVEGSWAAEDGNVRPGDFLVMVDDQSASDMEHRQFLEAMQKRPLKLGFARMAGNLPAFLEVATPPRAAAGRLQAAGSSEEKAAPVASAAGGEAGTDSSDGGLLSGFQQLLCCSSGVRKAVDEGGSARRKTLLM